MKEPFWQKLKRRLKLHGTFLFPHVRLYSTNQKGVRVVFCTCGWSQELK